MCVCVWWIPDEQLSEASLDGAVSVRALADIVDAVDVTLQGGAVGRQVAQLSDEDDFVTVVQGSWVPRQGAVTSVASGWNNYSQMPKIKQKQRRSKAVHKLYSKEQFWDWETYLLLLVGIY